MEDKKAIAQAIKEVDENLEKLQRRLRYESSKRYDLSRQLNSNANCVVFAINNDIYSKPTWIPRNWMRQMKIPVRDNLLVESIDYDNPPTSKYLVYEFNGKVFDEIVDKVIYNAHDINSWQYPVMELNLSKSSL